MENTILIRIDDLNEKSDAEKVLERSSGNNIEENSTKPNSKKIKDTANVAATHILIDGIKDMTVNASTTAISNIGFIFEDTALQNEINNSMSTLGTTVNSVSRVASAAILAGPIGAGITAALEAANYIGKMINNNIQYRIRLQEDYLNTVNYSERIGVLSTDKNRR